MPPPRLAKSVVLGPPLPTRAELLVSFMRTVGRAGSGTGDPNGVAAGTPPFSTASLAGLLSTVSVSLAVELAARGASSPVVSGAPVRILVAEPPTRSACVGDPAGALDRRSHSQLSKAHAVTSTSASL